MAIKGCGNKSDTNIFQENAEFEYYYQIAEYYESCNHIQEKTPSNIWQYLASLMQDLNINSSVPKENALEVISNAISIPITNSTITVTPTNATVLMKLSITFGSVARSMKFLNPLNTGTEFGIKRLYWKKLI